MSGNEWGETFRVRLDDRGANWELEPTGSGDLFATLAGQFLSADYVAKVYTRGIDYVLHGGETAELIVYDVHVVVGSFYAPLNTCEIGACFGSLWQARRFCEMSIRETLVGL